MLIRLALAAIMGMAVLGTASAQLVVVEDNSGISYPSVATAFDAVQAKLNVEMSVQDGWTVIAQYSGLARWIFSQPGHPAHPTLIKSEVALPADGSSYIRVGVLCEAEKAACEKVKVEFLARLNDQLRRVQEQRPALGGKDANR